MVRDHRGRDWSVATKDCPDFLGSSRAIQKSNNPVFSKVPHKNFKVLLKKIFVRELWFTWISGLLDYNELDETMRPNHWDGGSMLSYQLQSILWSVNATAAVTGA
jgi:hypothetical protein